MKKTILSVLFTTFICMNSYAKEPLKINLENISKQALTQTKPVKQGTIKSELDVTHLLAFVDNWKTLDSRTDELLDLYSDVIPEAFKKYSSSKEFHFATYIKYKNKKTNKMEHKYISKVVITRDDANKIDWCSIKENKSESYKHFKTIDFSKI
ncbi:MAG: hypothetical protein U0457_12980 [Candidatus Sericytochromatia bacterium]